MKPRTQHSWIPVFVLILTLILTACDRDGGIATITPQATLAITAIGGPTNTVPVVTLLPPTLSASATPVMTATLATPHPMQSACGPSWNFTTGGVAGKRGTYRIALLQATSTPPGTPLTPPATGSPTQVSSTPSTPGVTLTPPSTDTPVTPGATATAPGTSTAPPVPSVTLTAGATRSPTPGTTATPAATATSVPAATNTSAPSATSTLTPGATGTAIRSTPRTPAAVTTALSTPTTPTMSMTTTLSGAQHLCATLTRLLSEHEALLSDASGAQVGGRAAEQQAALAALAANTADLTTVLSAIYGAEAGGQFQALWRSHITELGNYTTARMQQNTAAAEQARTNLAKFAQDFGSLLNALNPNLAQASVAAAANEHVMTALAIIDAQVAGDQNTAYALKRQAHAHAQQMAVMLADAIVLQYPARFMP